MTFDVEQHGQPRRLLVALVVAVLALVVGVGAGVDARASSPGGQVAGTRVAAHELVAGPVVAASEDVLAGEGRRATTRGPDVAIGSRVAPSAADDFVNLASPSRTRHILDGEVRPDGSFGGGHRSGLGFPKKSEFPADWSDARIMHEISDVATDPRVPWRRGDGPTDYWASGTRGGVDIEVLIRDGEIWTGYHANRPRNPQ